MIEFFCGLFLGFIGGVLFSVIGLSDNKIIMECDEGMYVHHKDKIYISKESVWHGKE